MADGMEDYVPKVEKKQVDAGHWALLEKKDEVNELVMNWLSRLNRPVSL